MIAVEGFKNVQPYAVIVWHEGDKPICKTICYDELELQAMITKHSNERSMYAKLRPTIHYSAVLLQEA